MAPEGRKPSNSRDFNVGRLRDSLSARLTVLESLILSLHCSLLGSMLMLSACKKLGCWGLIVLLLCLAISGMSRDVAVAHVEA